MNFDGIKIYPVEIESVLLEHPSVAEAAAFAIPSEKHQDVPVAAVVARGPLDRAQLLAWCKQRLGVRAPQRIVVLEALPRNARGKVLKRELAARLARK
jgi:long-chain acyl-CoA synthetase